MVFTYLLTVSVRVELQAQREGEKVVQLMFHYYDSVFLSRILLCCFLHSYILRVVQHTSSWGKLMV